MIDLHCHILPGIDDGPDTIPGSLALARRQLELGVGTVAATPHVAPAMPNTAATIARVLAELHGALRSQGIDLRVVPGAEVDLGLASELSDDELRALALGGGPWLLVEAPLTSVAAGVDIRFRALARRGHRILIAHPERCPDFQRRPDALRELVREGMRVQVTAGALVGRFGGTVERFAHRLAADRMIHDVASDAHAAEGRAPGLRAELEACGLAGWGPWLTEAAPAAILAGTPLPPPPAEGPRPPRRGLLRRLRA